MKIALLTFHCAHSYGAVLQATALKTFLQKNGHEVTFVNYRPNSLVAKKFGIGNIINSFIFKRFENKLLQPQTEAFKTKDEIPKEIAQFDFYIVGSDQVWNLDFSKNEVLTYFFDFIPANRNKISYAASFGKTELQITNNKKNEIKKQLEQFKAISVREKSGLSILQKEFELEGEQTIDPTFLLKSEDYLQLFNIKIQNPQKQVLCFKFLKDEGFYETVNQIKNKYNLKIVIIGKPQNIKDIQFAAYPSPRKWVELFYRSEFVFTDSFHGLAFAIIFRKKMIVTPANLKRFTRIKDLLETLGLANRIYYNYNDILASDDWLQEIDYLSVNKKLNEYRNRSISFLHSNLQ